jgi:hypothetical protein
MEGLELWGQLPEQIISQILFQLSPANLARFRILCKACYQLSSAIWREWCQLPVRIFHTPHDLYWIVDRPEERMNIVFGWLEGELPMFTCDMMVREEEEIEHFKLRHDPGRFFVKDAAGSSIFPEQQLHVSIGTLSMLYYAKGRQALHPVNMLQRSGNKMLLNPECEGEDKLQIGTINFQVYRIDDGDYGEVVIFEPLIVVRDYGSERWTSPPRIYGSFSPHGEVPPTFPELTFISREVLASGWIIEKYTHH